MKANIVAKALIWLSPVGYVYETLWNGVHSGWFELTIFVLVLELFIAVPALWFSTCAWEAKAQKQNLAIPGFIAATFFALFFTVQPFLIGDPAGNVGWLVADWLDLAAFVLGFAWLGILSRRPQVSTNMSS